MSVAEKRVLLEPYAEHKGQFTGVFVRKGMVFKRIHGNKRIVKYAWLIADLRDELGQVVAEHIWIRQPIQARWLYPRVGDRVTCEGFSMVYRKKSGETDWCLRRVHDIQIVPQSCRHTPQ